MFTRADYQARGLEPVEYDLGRALRVVSARPMSANEREAFGQNADLPPHIAAMLGVPREPLPEGAPAQKVELDRNYNHRRDIERMAKTLHGRVAPTVDADDMPNSEVGKEDLLSRLSRRGEDLSKVSRLALEHELTPPAHYWFFANRALKPMLAKAITRAGGSSNAEAREAGVDALWAAGDFFSARAAKAEPMGRSRAAAVLQGAMEAPGAHWSKEDGEILMSHFVAHARMGNRCERQFEELRQTLPPEARKTADWIAQDREEVSVMWQINSMQTMPKGRFREISNDLHSQATRTMLESTSDFWNPFGSAPHAHACRKLSIAISRLPDDDPELLKMQSTLNREILKTFPDPGLDTCARILAAEVAGEKIASRERSLSQVMSGVMRGGR